MATAAKIIIGNNKEYEVIDCRLVLDRCYNKFSPTGYPYVKTLDITVYPDHQDVFFHKWYAQKNKEDLTLRIKQYDDEGRAARDHVVTLNSAFCYSLSENIESVDSKNQVRRRLLNLGIKSESVAIGGNEMQLYSYSKQKKQDVAVVNEPDDDKTKNRADNWPGNLTRAEKIALAEHSFKIEARYKIIKGDPMSAETADNQNANPKNVSKQILNDGKYRKSDGTLVPIKEYEYTKTVNVNGELKQETAKLIPEYIDNPDYNEARDRKFQINCATCSIAYVLRRQGFDFKAKGNVSEIKDKDGNIIQQKNDNNRLASGGSVFKVWKDANGGKAKPSKVVDWMKKNHVNVMTPDLYLSFIEENTQEEGIYILTCAWPGGTPGTNSSGHATIVERWRDDKGKLQLHRIEPQKYRGETRLSIVSYCNQMSPWPNDACGIMRVDNKLFDAGQYGELFEYTETNGTVHIT